MNTPKVLLITGILIVLAVPVVSAGQTTITGSASCVMPDFFEMKTQPVAPQTPQVQIQAPVPSGASGLYEVQAQEKMIQTEENKTTVASDGTQSKALVYTLCAK